MLGGLPADEDVPPEDLENLNPHLFDFFRFGQLGHAPVQAPLLDQNDAPMLRIGVSGQTMIINGSSRISCLKLNNSHFLFSSRDAGW